MADLSKLLQWNLNEGLLTVGGVPCLLLDYRTHLYIEQSISDLLGERQSAALRMSVARDAARALLTHTADAMGVGSGAPLFPFAVGLFRAFGCGTLRLETIEGRRRGVGERLFSSTNLLHHPELMATVSPSLEAMTAGWLAAAIELALARPANSVEVRQGGGVSSADDLVWFELGKGDGAAPRDVVHGELGPQSAWSGPAVSPWVEQLVARLESMTSQPDGLRDGLGLPMHLALAGYHLESVLTARIAALNASAELAALLDAAIVESWRLGFSGWLLETWQNESESRAGYAAQPEEVLGLASDVLALLGVGRVRFSETIAGGVRAESPGPLDALWCLQRVGVQQMASCLSLLGATQAVADVLAMLRRGDRVEPASWTRVQLTPSPFTPHVIRCVSTGSSLTEVAAERAVRIGGYAPVAAF